MPFARREIGPDYMARQRMDLLFEEWVHAWSPATEGRLIELSVHGDSLPAALRGHLMRERGRGWRTTGTGRDLGRLTAMLLRGVLAGMGAELAPFVAALERDIAAHGDFAAIAKALRQLVNIVEATGPLAAEDGVPLEPMIGAAFRRLVHLCDELPKTPPEEITARLDALRLMNELLRGDEGGRFEAGAVRCGGGAGRAGPGTPPEILGAALAVSHISGRGPGDRLATALKGQFAGAHVAPVARIGLLRGVLTTAPALMWREAGLVGVVDGFLSELDEAEFLTLLPHLRLAFTTLNPRETDRLAGLLAAHLGVQGDTLSLVAADVSEADMLRGAAIEARLAAAVEADGLDGWLSAGGEPMSAPTPERWRLILGRYADRSLGTPGGPRGGDRPGARLPLCPRIRRARCASGPWAGQPGPDADVGAEMAGPGAQAVPRRACSRRCRAMRWIGTG